MWKPIRRWVADEDGQGLAEYAWITVLVAAACAGTVALLGSKIAEVLYEPVTRMFG